MKINKKTVYKQELLLKRALKEKGLKLSRLIIRIDHKLGKNFVNDIPLGIIYPESFFVKTLKLLNESKKNDFYFNGNMGEKGGRKKLLSPFQAFDNSRIIESNFGRISLFKSQFNYSYFKEFVNSKYGLCPHQIHWDGDYIWTYRFIESCISFSIPILFKRTPLSDSFIDGFNIIWDTEIISNNRSVDFEMDAAISNYIHAKKKFCLTDENISDILKTII